MPNYNNSIIYKLCCKDPEITDIYIGSTINFINRKRKHKSDSTNERSPHHNSMVHKFIRQNGGWGNWDMVQVEAFKCDTKRELHVRERHYIEELKATLNKNIPNRTEYEHKEQIKEYYQQNKEQIKEYHKQWQERNKDYNKQWRECNKEYHKQWRERNKDYDKQWRERKKHYDKQILLTK